MINLESLPPVMKQRAIWARKTIIDYPEESHIDYDEMLAWVYNKEDNLWYSIAGNYSRKSPEEKMLSREEYRQKMEKYAFEWKKEWEEKYWEQQYWSKIRKDILERDNYTCQLCNKLSTTKLHIHHILKRRKGGTDYIDNLLTVCPSCHKKADTSLYDPDWIDRNWLKENYTL